MPELGLGIITYNRKETLQGCLERIRSHTRTPYQLVVADDGSEDGSAEWARSQGIRVVTGRRRGVVWNKNRALAYLQEYTDCDPIMLLEEDTWPTEAGWEEPWVEAALHWGHISFGRLVPGSLVRGAGTVEDPFLCRQLGGVCLTTSRAALWSVGYFDPRFQGYGFSHAEWTYRFVRLFAGRWYPPLRGLEDLTCRCLTSGLELIEVETWWNQREVDRNRDIFLQLLGEPIWRPPVREETELKILGEELGEALGLPAGDVCRRLRRAGLLPGDPGLLSAAPEKPRPKWRRLMSAALSSPRFSPR
jgi:glycosyltransferase involved in cell wall biosynthesis